MQVSHAKLVPLKWWDLFFFWNKRCPGSSVFVTCWGPAAGATCFVPGCRSRTAGQVVPVRRCRSGVNGGEGYTAPPAVWVSPSHRVTTPQGLCKPASPAFLNGLAKEKRKEGQSSVISLDFKSASGRAGFGRKVLLSVVSLWQWVTGRVEHCVSKQVSFHQYGYWSIPVFMKFVSVLVLLDGNMAWFVVRQWALGMPITATGAPHSLMSFGSATLDWHKGTPCSLFITCPGKEF